MFPRLCESSALLICAFEFKSQTCALINIFIKLTPIVFVQILLKRRYAFSTINHCFLAVLTYTLDVFTGNFPEAGTDANVYAMLVGERGDTGFRKLLKSLASDADNPSESFQTGQVSLKSKDKS